MIETLRRMVVIGFVALFVAPLSLFAPTAQAQGTYAAEIVSITNNGVLRMAPDARTTVEVVVKNTGNATWTNDGTGYISLYTHDPKYRRSVFDPGTWIWWNQAKRINEKTVTSGARATLTFDLHAPSKEGVYTEVFHLASEERAWVNGGKIALTIHVEAKANPTPVAPANVQVVSKAELVAQTISEITAKAGSPIVVQAAIKNTGVQQWNGFGVLAPTAHIAAGQIAFTDSSWTSVHAGYVSGVVKPGETGVVSFTLRAPKQNGTHTASFEVVTDEGRRTGTFIDISVNVTDGVRDVIDAPPAQEPIVTYIDEPILRVGTLIVDEETNHEVKIRSNTGPLQIVSKSGVVLGEVVQGQIVQAAYAGGKYTYDLGDGARTTTEAIRFVPPAPTDVLEVTNFDRRVTRRAQFADNTFRGTLELHHNTAKNRAWLINEIPIELYMRGIAETGDTSPYEYQKAMMIAARSYAYYDALYETRWRSEHFMLTAYSYDQVYNGYGREMRSPNTVKAVEETRGVMVTYAGKVIPTPYFSRSDGRTRTWSDVWSGSQPWAIGVSVPCEKGKTLLGHGIGMSAQGAICFANEGMTGEEILKYFYTGVELVSLWK